MTPKYATGSTRDVNVDRLKITYDQGDGTELVFDSHDNTYSYLHVSQGDIQKFSGDPDALSEEIKRMLGIHTSSFDSITSTAITENIGKYRAFVDYWEASDQSGNRINTPEYQSNVIDRNTKLMSTITNPQNKALIQQYQSNLTFINTKQSLINDTREIQATIQRNLQDINTSLDLLNGRQELPQYVPLINSLATEKKLTENIEALQTEINFCKRKNAEIVEQFHNQGINQDISSLLDKVLEYQSAIDSAKKRLADIEEKTNHYHNYVHERARLVCSYQKYLEEQKSDIDNRFKVLTEYKGEWTEDQNSLVTSMLKDININGAIIFNSDNFYDGLENCLNRGKFRSTQNQTSRERLEQVFNVQSLDDFFSLVSGNAQIVCEGEFDEKLETLRVSIEEFFWKREYFNQGGRFELLNYLFSPESIKNYLYVNAEFEYKGKTVDKLSVGQRGTFYVCLKLATDPFGSPFVFDQPEDDLDNDFIMSQLVPLFRRIKKYRQVIIVTHNANLVVNTDAEQIIVANNEGEVISYEAGALEDGSIVSGEGTKASICNILEGGSHAFEKRERKYGIQSQV